MLMYFADEGTAPARALQIWLILIGSAIRRETQTYGEIAEAIGVPAIAVGGFLNYIHHFCEQNDLPQLTVLVVRQDTGEPGDGYLGSRCTMYSDREQVYQYDWFCIFPPALHQLEEAISRV